MSVSQDKAGKKYAKTVASNMMLRKNYANLNESRFLMTVCEKWTT